MQPRSTRETIIAKGQQYQDFEKISQEGLTNPERCAIIELQLKHIKQIGYMGIRSRRRILCFSDVECNPTEIARKSFYPIPNN